MNAFITLWKQSGVLPSLLLVSIAMATGFPLVSTPAFAETVSQPSSGKDALPDDYFHIGAGSRY
jgi:hypothetical protein